MSGRSPGARCQWILQRCLAIHLTRCDPRRVVPPPPPPDPPPQPIPASPPQHYWMYDSGYLIFQGFLEANLKCFWNPGLMDAVRQLEFQGWVAPGVLLVTANPCALEVVRAAWARNVLKAPPSYSLALVGDVEDCLIQPISQGQFTPLPEALCWIILELTSLGQAAVMESIKKTLDQVFPDIQRPSHDLIYDTLAQLSAERKVYQTSGGYFVMTPESRRLRSHSRSRSAGRSGTGHESPRVAGGRQPLMSTEEAVAFVHGEMETLRDGNLTHQAIQTNLADVICGGNSNDKVLYGRVPSGRRLGNGLERRHSLRLFGSNKRLATLHRSGSMRLLNSSRYADHSDHANSDSTLVTPKKSLSLLSRLFRRSKRRLGGNRGAAPLSTFSAQFPPSEWFNSRVVHLHSVGTQTQQTRASPLSMQDKGDGWRSCNDDHGATLPHRHRRQSSSSGLSHPPSRRASPSPVSKTLTPSASSSKSVSPSRSSLSSSKTVVNNRCLSSPTAKSLSSSSSGYNSLPRSKSPARSQSRNSTPKGSPLHSATPKLSPNKSSITVQVSTNQNASNNGSIISNQIKSSLGGETSSIDDKNSTTMTTTINGPNTTKIFVQQQNSPVRSVITFENGTSKSNTGTKDLIVINPSKPTTEVKPVNEMDKKYKQKVERPTSLYSPKDNDEQNENNILKNDKIFGQLETQLKMKFPSSETIQLEEKLLASTKNNNKNHERQQISSKERITKNIALKAGSLMDMSNVNFGNDLELNNVRKSSISSTQTLQSSNCKENLSYKNLLKDTLSSNTTTSSDRTLIPLILNKDEKNLCNSNPPSPTKSLSNVYINDSFSNFINSGGDSEKVTGCNMDKNEPIGKLSESFPSLSDLSLHFTSIAAQNILKGVSINSIDTLVEVNMAAEKQNNCDVTIHTDFGCV
ncbi:stork-head domain-containing protein knockout [Lycorma delicatula]|uniref:stork-head domain-containing protein knockout n=1 Tax=Lycorma delicatula TaxID=130591 RepID=UPI003F5186BE